MEKRYPTLCLGAALLPWKEDFTLDEPLFRRQLKRMVDGGLRYIYIFGTAGEGYAVDDGQFVDITRIFVDELSGTGATPIVGVISLSAPQIIARIKLAYRLGVRDFQISFPSWGALTDQEVDVFFHQVCDGFPDCNFMHYNNGGRSKKLLKAKDYVRIAAEIPNLVAVKFMNTSMEDIINAVTADTPVQFVLSEYGYGYGCLFGECSILFISTISHLPTGWKLFEAGQRKDTAAIAEVVQEVAANQEILFRTCATPVIDSAYDKLYTKTAIPEFPTRLYPPYQGFSDEQVEHYLSEMRRRLPHWFGGA